MKEDFKGLDPALDRLLEKMGETMDKDERDKFVEAYLGLINDVIGAPSEAQAQRLFLGHTLTSFLGGYVCGRIYGRFTSAQLN